MYRNIKEVNIDGNTVQISRVTQHVYNIEGVDIEDKCSWSDNLLVFCIKNIEDNVLIAELQLIYMSIDKIYERSVIDTTKINNIYYIFPLITRTYAWS